MQKYVRLIGFFIIKLFLGFVVFAGISFVVSHYFDFTLSDTFTVIGILLFLCGLLSLVGGMNMSSDIKYYQSISVSEKSFGDKVREEFKSRDKKIGFLLYMALLGSIMVALGYLFL